MKDDTISRKAAIECLEHLSACDEPFVEIGIADETFIGKYEAITEISDLPSAQPQLPEWAQKVEEYRKIAPKTFSSPIAWALYQTWREYAERRTDGSD